MTLGTNHLLPRVVVDDKWRKYPPQMPTWQTFPLVAIVTNGDAKVLTPLHTKSMINGGDHSRVNFYCFSHLKATKLTF